MAVTIKELARASGLSTATVSYVLNDKPVSAKSKKRVLEAVKFLNYQPSAVARSLRTNKTFTIGLVLKNPQHELVGASVRTAQGNNYHLVSELFESRDKKGEVKAHQNLVARRVDGVLIWPEEKGIDYSTIVENYRRNDIPVVMLDRHLPGIAVPSFCFDNRRGMKMAWQYLNRIGRKPIVYVDFAKDISTLQERREGLRDAHLDEGVRWNEEYHIKALNEGRFDQEALKKAIDLANHGGAILTAADHIAYAIIRIAMKFNKRIPDDFALVGFEDVMIWLGERVGWTTSPPLTTVRMRFNEMGMQATKYLLNLINNKNKMDGLNREKIFKIAPQFVIRKSCGGYDTGVYSIGDNDELTFIKKEEFFG